MSAEFIVSYLICIFIKWLWDLAGKPFIENNTVLLPFWVLVFSSGDILVDKHLAPQVPLHARRSGDSLTSA